ncbi:MAG: RsiV family protein [Phocaeicola sp.]
MKKIILTISLAGMLFATGCTSAGKEKSIQNVTVELKAPLCEQEKESPACLFSANMAYFQEGNRPDSIVDRINRGMITISLGEEYSKLTPTEAIDSFKNEYIATYRKEVNDFYQEDLKTASDKSEIPSWYNYEFDLTTELREGKAGVFNYCSTTTEYRGGAHSNKWTKWVNFSIKSGEIITLDDIFSAGYKKKVSDLLLEGLIAEVADRLEDTTIKTLSDLQNNGVLNYTDIYVPDNFLLEREGVSFFFNNYDIAPYYMGSFEITIPYSQLENIFIY